MPDSNTGCSPSWLASRAGQLASVLAIACITLMLASCGDAPDEDQIAAVIADITEAIEEKSFTAIGAHLHSDFLANERLTADDAKRMLQAYSLQHRRLSATVLGSNTIVDDIYDDRAESTLSVIVTGSSGRLPSDGSVRTVKVQWIKQGDEWLIRRANWRRR